ncbi:MAG: DNA-formamidopyrimidine glycosylase family protein, partial [Bacteroidota bacterium]
RNVDAHTFIEKTTGRTFTSSYRRGKYLFGKMDNEQHVLFHFGMTGDLRYYEDEMDKPKYERFVFSFANGYKLGFDCPRKFARILLIEDLQQYISEVKLGEDALVISEKDFLAKMEGRKSTIKGFLLNQKILAGVGNLYADEICYQTKIHPASVVNALSKRHKKAIYKAMKDILQTAVDRTAYYKDYPDDWFFQWREEGKKAPKGKGVAKSAKIAGRTTFFFEGYQKLYNQ